MPLVERLRAYRSNAGYAKYARQAAELLEVRERVILRLTEHNAQMAHEIAELKHDQGHKIEHITVLSDQVNEQNLRAQEKIHELQLMVATHEQTIAELCQQRDLDAQCIEMMRFMREQDQKVIESMIDDLGKRFRQTLVQRIKQWWEDRQ
jgi:threonine aldolase